MSKTSASILIIEDDDSIRLGLSEVLSAHGYQPQALADGLHAVDTVVENEPDLIILDVMLPHASGYDIAKTLRRKKIFTPILMLTAKGQELDKVVGLQAGADDYLTKPFGLEELLARVSALLRRTQQWASNEAPPQPTLLTAGPITIDASNHTISHEGGLTHSITPKEMDLLACLYARRNTAVSREQILDEVWGTDYLGTTRALDQCVTQLRKKIDTGTNEHFLIETVYGFGYRLRLAD